jgi:cytochrome b561
MASDSSPEHYSPTQIVLHWIVVIGVITQLSLNEPIVRVIDAYRSGETPLPSDMTFAWIHVAVGSTVLLSVLGRLFLRVRRGVPKPVPGTTRLAARSADFVHLALYALLLAVVVTGILTWNGAAPLGGVHFGLAVALVVLIAGHAGAALYNQFVRKDGTLLRMTRFANK